jgi:hypothetical protein
VLPRRKNIAIAVYVSKMGNKLNSFSSMLWQLCYVSTNPLRFDESAGYLIEKGISAAEETIKFLEGFLL